MDDDCAFRPTGILNAEHITRFYDNENGSSNKEDMDEFWKRDLWLLHEYALVLRRRRVFVTSDGKLGLGVETARVGDDVALVHGSETPLILGKRQ
jgi:hypothetical protein